ncbi:MAG: hypothetical protein E7261_04120 [Lachnospiraceae bacterium]|nr:hypothetical protein [Lachnospiraceae bacterium]
MKIKFLSVLCILFFIPLTGCAKYEEDLSQNVEIYGLYLQDIISTDSSYILNESYNFNQDNTYQHIVKEVFSDTVMRDSNTSGEILVIEELSDELTKITLSQKVIDFWTREESNEILYKYKNMLGNFCEAEIPNSKTFNLELDGIWFDKDGQYHICAGAETCDCSPIKYIKKDNIIYFQSISEKGKYYTIAFYVLDEGLFSPELYKVEE